jgi:DNA polymerase I-like protein with 3'-5' exonuclease and polymerase domains
VFHPAYVARVWSDRQTTVQDLRRVARESQHPAIITPPYRFDIAPSFDKVMQTIRYLRGRVESGHPWISADIETAHHQMLCLGLAWTKYDAMCIPFWQPGPHPHYFSLDEEVAIVLALRDLMGQRSSACVIGQNFVYDSQYFGKLWGWIPRLRHDTMIAQSTMFPGTTKGLDYLASMYCTDYRYWKDDGKEWNIKGSIQDLWTYNCEDCCRTLEVKDEQDSAAASLGRRPQVEFQQNLARAVIRMTLRGVRSNEPLRAEMKQELHDARANRSASIERILGHPINIASPKQLHLLFYEDLRLAPVLHRKTRKPTLDEEAMAQLTKREPIVRPLARAITEWRSLGVFESNFIDTRLEHGRIFTSFNVAGTKTFRFSSSTSVFGSGGNLQNVPKGTDAKICLYTQAHGPTTVSKLQETFGWTEAEVWDKLDDATDAGLVTVSNRGSATLVTFRFLLPNVRRLFLPDPGYVLMDWDLDRADLQYVIWEANDRGLQQALREGVDLHQLNATTLGCERRLAKMWVHGTNYGGSATTMARNCGITVHKSEQMRRRWFEAHTGIRGWHNRTEAQLLHFRTVSNRFGFKIHFFDRPEGLLPEALAWQPQSAVAIVINTALQRIEEQLYPRVELLLQIHDSLVMQAKAADVAAGIEDEIRPLMQVEIPFDEPLIIPTSCKKSDVSWGDVK